ncbi:patatin-like phospholipase family protein [Marinobacter litoralis]|uniref:patatin-like phospholipase family protein n=1 Tax=Marinobacter litoralis TaxID=187981 RepID=UPI0018EC75E0|nr:patatin-like phospholipase family protein [Marinobacter litoralis]MBJ6135974.1 patatin-like phospholipase family protein [Marinobacter litoralis]
MRLPVLIAVVVAFAALPALVAAQETRPKVGLVLSGGGAKGMAHVGVLRVLEEIKVPVDMVVGTSAGSAVAALYASGMSVHEIEQRFIDLDWLSSFRDDPGRAYKPVRRKQSDWRLPITPGIGVDAEGVHVGGGLVTGQNLGLILNELTRNAALVDDFDQLPIPFRAIATDLETGVEVVIDSGNLAEAIRASMSIPGIYAPVERGGRLLVDGGIANNLPVSVARDMGADIIIAVDITDPLLKTDDIKEAFSVVGQLTTLLTRRNTEEQLALITDKDILIRPRLEGYGSADFYDGPVLFELGATAAREHAVELNRLAVPAKQWQAFRAGLEQRSASYGHVARIEFNAGRRLSTDFLKERIRQKPGEPLDIEQLESDLKRIYGLGYYETVSWSLRPSKRGPVLDIKAREKRWGPNYLSFGLNYEDNFDGDTRFNLASGLRMTELNSLGAEWHTGVQLGTEPWVRTQWYQPLDFGYERFAVIGLEHQRDEYSVYDDGTRISQIDVTLSQADLAIGMELGGDGEIRIGYVRGSAKVDDEVGQKVAPSGRINQGYVNVQLVHDSLSDAFYPKSGGFAGIRARFERNDFGSDRNFDSLTGMLLGTTSWQRFNVTGLLFTEQVISGESGIENAARLGGFRRLSAYAAGELSGNDAALAAAYARREFGGPFMPWFAGVGFETGNTWDQIDDARWDNLVRSWSVFAGVDTFVGPVQFSVAYNNEDDWTAYMNIGFSFTQLFY